MDKFKPEQNDKMLDSKAADIITNEEKKHFEKVKSGAKVKLIHELQSITVGVPAKFIIECVSSSVIPSNENKKNISFRRYLNDIITSYIKTIGEEPACNDKERAQLEQEAKNIILNFATGKQIRREEYFENQSALVEDVLDEAKLDIDKANW